MDFRNSDTYSFADKWSDEIEMYSFTQVPNLLLACQSHLELTDGEILTLIHLITFWFGPKSKVYPSISTLAKFSDKGYSTIQLRLRNLEEKGFIERNQRVGTSNDFNLNPCVLKLYKHTLICQNLPRNRGQYIEKSVYLPQPKTRNKEDQQIIRLPSSNTANIWELYSQKLGSE